MFVIHIVSNIISFDLSLQKIVISKYNKSNIALFCLNKIFKDLWSESLWFQNIV